EPRRARVRGSGAIRRDAPGHPPSRLRPRRPLLPRRFPRAHGGADRLRGAARAPSRVRPRARAGLDPLALGARPRRDPSRARAAGARVRRSGGGRGGRRGLAVFALALVAVVAGAIAFVGSGVAAPATEAPGGIGSV